MEPRQVRTAADALRIVKERKLSHVKVGVHDIDGVLRGKYLHIDKFKSALEGGMGFCDVVLGWDANDQLYDNVTMTGWHTGDPDATTASQISRIDQVQFGGGPAQFGHERVLGASPP